MKRGMKSPAVIPVSPTYIAASFPDCDDSFGQGSEILKMHSIWPMKR